MMLGTADLAARVNFRWGDGRFGLASFAGNPLK